MERYLPDQDVTLSDADVIVNLVNCVGVMGKGVALAFRERFGAPALKPYFDLCRARALKPGDCPILAMPDGRLWAAFATKAHWRDPARMDWIERGLDHLAEEVERVGARSVALPPPGCGYGGLDWAVVEPMVLENLGRIGLERLDICGAASTLRRENEGPFP